MNHFNYGVSVRAKLLMATMALSAAFLPRLLLAQSSPLTVQPSTGRVGVGTTSPAHKLDVRSGQFFLGDRGDGCCSGFLMDSGGQQTHFYTYAAGRFGIHKYGAGSAAGEVFSIVPNGNVGIGTTNPSSLLHVNGTFTATTKNFQIDHPLESDKKHLVHSALEGPEVAVYYRGKAQLVNGEAVIDLPSYFEPLTQKEQRTVQLTPIGGWAPLYVEDEVKEGQFKVKAANGSNPNQRFYWEVKAVRADVPDLVVEKLKDPESLKLAKGLSVDR